MRPKVKRVVGLTGTPSSNGLMDLWAEFRLLDMGKRLGRFITHFRSDYFVPDKRNQQIVFSYKPKPGAEEAIYRLVSDITISMKSTDYLKMPECVINEVSVQLSEKEMECYKTLKNDLILSLDGQDIDAASSVFISISKPVDNTSNITTPRKKAFSIFIILQTQCNKAGSKIQ